MLPKSANVPGGDAEPVTFDEPDPDQVASEPEHVAQPEPEIEIPEPEVEPTVSVADFGPQPGAESSSMLVSFLIAYPKGAWYINGDLSSHKDIQSVLLPIITDAINNELSFESKKSLVEELQSEVLSLHKKLAIATEEELRVLAHEYGLGNTINEVPSGKERKWYIEWILKYGRRA